MNARIAMLVGAVLVVLGLGSGVYAIYSTPAQVPNKVAHVSDDVTGIWTGRSYAYVVQRDSCLVLIDAGSDPAGTALMGHFGLQQLTPDNVSAVLLTHGHIDHRAALHLMNRAAVYVGRDDAQLARGDALPHAPYARLLQRIAPGVPQPQQPFDMPLPGTQLNICGLNFDVIALPGHTPGSLAYRLGNILFAGDAIALDKGTIAPPGWGWSENAAHARAILQRLGNVPFTGIAMGHDGWLPDGDKLLKGWLIQPEQHAADQSPGAGRTAITAGNG